MLIFGSGLAMGLAPAPLNLWPLAFVSLVPLWTILLKSQSSWAKVKLRFLLPYPLLWGLGYHGLALSWITHLHPLTWMGIPWLGSLAIALFAWGFITLWGTALVVIWFTLLRWLWSTLPASPSPGSFFRVLSATALWCSLETIWSWGPLYWTSLSYTQSPGNLALLHLGQISGQFTVTAVIVAVNGWLALAWISRAQSQSWRGQPGRLLLGATGFLLACYLVGYGLKWSAPADSLQQKLQVGLIQGNVPTRIKLTPAGERQAIAGYTQGYLDLVDQGVDVVITPEGSLPMIWQEPVQSRSPLYQAVLQKKVALWLGTFAIAEDTAPPQLTQSLLAINAEGQTVGRYNKVKLVPLGEYIPFEAVLGRLIQRLSSMEGSLMAGDSRQMFNTSFGPVAIGICYESAYGEIFRYQVAQGGQLIVTVSNNDPYPPGMMAQDHAQDVMRAIESDRWAVRVTNTGLSGIVDAQGHTLWLSAPNRYVIHAASVYRRQSQTLYVRWGNWLTPVLLLATLIFYGVAGFTRPAHLPHFPHR
ncbi:MAG: apolipoprotein N-acyltransferase [Leptolyngbyaceae cyanobacterium SL_1_1]|nr:apolipoprotein N-acyltransferase [Leptolyngbyaceae cyanobacterium RM1_1_2]NJO08538.1 apolipoprotein N-acyltransferase [Leptolyngbyaceae cyanobacterium SL_1_1]